MGKIWADDQNQGRIQAKYKLSINPHFKGGLGAFMGKVNLYFASDSEAISFFTNDEVKR